jgi:hypothetical protein
MKTKTTVGFYPHQSLTLAFWRKLTHLIEKASLWPEKASLLDSSPQKALFLWMIAPRRRKEMVDVRPGHCTSLERLSV